MPRITDTMHMLHTNISQPQRHEFAIGRHAISIFCTLQLSDELGCAETEDGDGESGGEETRECGGSETGGMMEA